MIGVERNDKRPLYLRDPRKFFEVFQNPSVQERFDNYKTIDEVAVCEFFHHAYLSTQEHFVEIGRFYENAISKAPLEVRRDIFRHVKGLIEAIGRQWVEALVPIWAYETDLAIVSTAVLDYASMGAIQNDDPMFRVKYVCDAIQADAVVNKGAVFGGLAALGDARVFALLEHLRPTLSVQEIEATSKCYSGFTSLAQIEFFLDWAESLVDEQSYESEGALGHVQAGLARLMHKRSHQGVFVNPRPFPTPKNGPWTEIKTIDDSEVRNLVSDRMYEIEYREIAPKVMPHVMKFYGIEPKSQQKDIADLDIPVRD